MLLGTGIAVAALAVTLGVFRVCRAHDAVAEMNDLAAKAAEARSYCRANGMNTDFCFLVDFGTHSGKKRFYVWDFNSGSVLCSSLCAHGYGQNSTASEPVFSNVPGSYCSSLGKYKVGARSWSQWGINVHYKLHGLEPTNDKAYERIVVLHSFDPVPEVETYPVHLPLGMSQGCPVVSNQTMKAIDRMLKESKKPALLWIYN